MRVDIVVVNYKTPDLLLNFLRSVRDLVDRHQTTLTVVDVCPNQSFSTNGEYLGNGLYIQFDENVGYGRACNIGASGGEFDVILLANADTLLTDGFKECVDQLMAHEDWGVLGPRQVNEQGRITAGGIFGYDQSPTQRGWNEADYGQYSDIRDDALSVSGALYFIKRSVWHELTKCPLFQQSQPDSVGAFLETPHYFDETFCSYHARAHGHKVVYYGPVQMTHLWHKASEHGGWADQQFVRSQAMHREACAVHGIECE
jgi:GT2 family glycosyltransferase